MTNKAVIQTEKAPAAIGTYSQAIKVNNTVYLSGQIPLDPASMQMVDGDMRAQITQVFENLSAVCEAAGGSLKDIVKLNIPTAQPLVYELDENCKPIRSYYLGDPEAIAAAMQAVANQGKAK